MDEPIRECRLCGRESAWLLTSSAERQAMEFKCQNCGTYSLHEGFSHRLHTGDRRVFRGLSVERNIRNMGSLRIAPDTAKMLRSQAPADPAEAADRFLLNLAKKSSESGIMTALNIDMARGMAFTDAIDSVYANLDFLKNEGWIDYRGGRFSSEPTSFRLTLKGWRQVRSLLERGQDSDIGFVAMSFKPTFNLLFDVAIKPAIEKAGWRSIRADKVHHNSRIDDWILNQISSARFVIVDTTNENSGAMMEAGYALGVNRPVIWTVQQDWMDKGLHFDIRQYNHLKWHDDNMEDLIEPLSQRIVAAVGRGPVG